MFTELGKKEGGGVFLFSHSTPHHFAHLAFIDTECSHFCVCPAQQGGNTSKCQRDFSPPAHKFPGILCAIQACYLMAGSRMDKRTQQDKYSLPSRATIHGYKEIIDHSHVVEILAAIKIHMVAENTFWTRSGFVWV